MGAGNGWGGALAFAVGRRLRFVVSCSAAGFFTENRQGRCAEEFHRFFTAFSVRPGISLEISAHLFPFDAWSSLSVASSSWKERKKRRGRREEDGERKKVEER